METQEKVLIGVALAAAVAILLFNYRPGMNSPSMVVDESLTPENTPANRGPEFLTYNMPYAFAPPVFNFLPVTTAGQVGQVVLNPNKSQPCGCV